MRQVHRERAVALVIVGALGAVCSVGRIDGAAQEPQGQLVRSGQIQVDGRSTPYVIRHLPVSSFPELPEAVAKALNERGCLIPQTYQAHRPENVVEASLERARRRRRCWQWQ